MPQIVYSVAILLLSLMACSSHKEVQRTEEYRSELQAQKNTVERGYLQGIGNFFTSTDITASDVTIDFNPQFDSTQARASPCRIKIGQLKKNVDETAGLHIRCETSKEDSLNIHTNDSADIEQIEESSKGTINWRSYILAFLSGIITFTAGWIYGKQSKGK